MQREATKLYETRLRARERAKRKKQEIIVARSEKERKAQQAE